MQIMTLRPCVVRGVTVPAGMPVELMDIEAEPFLLAGDAEEWDPNAAPDEEEGEP